MVAGMVVRKGLAQVTNCGQIPRALRRMGPKTQAPVFPDPRKLEQFYLLEEMEVRGLLKLLEYVGGVRQAREAACGNVAGPGRVCGGHRSEAMARPTKWSLRRPMRVVSLRLRLWSLLERV